MRKHIKLLLIITAVFLTDLFIGKAEVKAAFCGVGEGYRATVNINAKYCLPQWNGVNICENNGVWGCNGSNWSCEEGNISGSLCYTDGYYGTTPNSCYVYVGAVSSNTAEDSYNGCNIYNGGYSCDPIHTPVEAGCWVYDGASSSPSPSPGASTVPSTCSCSGIEYFINPPTTNGESSQVPLQPNIPTLVNIRRNNASSNVGWDNVVLYLDGGLRGLALGYGDGVTNLEKGYSSTIDSGIPALHTLQFGINSGSCLCNSTSFTTSPLPPGKVQGCKVLGTSGCYGAGNSVFTLNSTPVTLDGTAATSLGNAALNSYSFPSVSAGLHAVAVPSVPAGYSLLGYSYCNGATNCHSSYTGGNTVDVDVPADGYTDLYWHFNPPPSCVFTLDPASRSVSVGSTTTYTAHVTVVAGGTVDRIDFSSLDTGKATVVTLPGSYTTTATGQAVGSTTIKADCIMGGAIITSHQSAINVIPPGAWWQVVGGNVHANNGTVQSIIPSTATLPYLITGTKGLLSYFGTLPALNGARINQAINSEWLAETQYGGQKTDYAYFKQILAEDPTPVNDWDGSKPTDTGVYTHEEDIPTSGTWTEIPSGQQSVILVNGKVTINTDITVAKGGFLAIIASGNIEIDPSVKKLQGVYITDKVIDTGGPTNPLQAEGIFVGWDGFNFQRDLTDNSHLPAERFTYRGDLVVNAYKYLLKSHINWSEVAP